MFKKISDQKKLNIAILTWRLYNFGTALQSYALYHWIRNNGMECKLIKYSLPSTDKIIRLNPLTLSSLTGKIKNRLRSIIDQHKNKATLNRYSKDIKEYGKHFENFYLEMSTENTLPFPDNANYYNTNYNFIIVGSDQVWNPKYLTETYFLDFIDDSKKVAYAPSLGINSLSEAELTFITERIAKFHFLSVREKTSANLLGLSESQVMCDPVLLLSANEWKQKLQLNHKEGNYLFVYTLSPKDWYLDIINKSAKIYGIDKIIVVTSSNKLYFYDNSKFEIKIDVGPIEWLEYLLNAKAVVTDSFHGVCFSIIFNKDFVALERFSNNEKGNENSRVTDLLKEMNLTEHFIKNGDDLEFANIKTENYYIHSLNRFRKHSSDYLLEVINHYGHIK